MFADIEGLIRDFCDAMGGRYVPLPTWHGLGDRRLAITHPLGGCRIGDSRENGVVNAVGQVYDAAADDPTAVHPGLHIVDASVLPGAGRAPEHDHRRASAQDDGRNDT